MAVWSRVISSVTLMPFNEMAPAVMNSRAFFLESAKPVATSASTKFVPFEIVGKKLANSEFSSVEKLVKSVFLSNRS